jgi:hypothetical protein
VIFPVIISCSSGTVLTALLFLLLILFVLFKLLVVIIRALSRSVHYVRYVLAARTAAEGLSLALHPAGRLTMLAVASHLSRPRRGLYINSWSPRESPSIYSLSISRFVTSLYADAPRSYPAVPLLFICLHDLRFALLAAIQLPQC